MASITEAEILEALHALNDGADGFTSQEMADQLGICQAVAQEKIRKLARSGRLECVGRRASIRTDGIGCKVPVYRLLAA